MKLEQKDLQLTAKTEATLKLQDLDFVVEELEDETAATIGGGAGYYSASNPKQRTRENRYYKDNVYALIGG